jgi:hypothetical protein
MSLDLSAPLPSSSTMPAVGPTGLPQKTAADYPTKFEDVAPGSTVLVGGRGVAGEPFRATVLDAVAEYGPTGIPALLISDASNEPYYIPASGLYEVQVLVNGRDLAAKMPLPEGGVKVRTIVRGGEAVRFRGGIESAAEIVRWAIGSATFRYVRETDVETDHLVQSGLRGDRVMPGDWVLKDEDGKFHVIPDGEFATEWEEA